MSENGKTRVAPRTSDVGSDYPEAFPNSKKVYIDGSRGIRVPMREIHLTGGYSEKNGSKIGRLLRRPGFASLPPRSRCQLV